MLQRKAHVQNANMAHLFAITEQIHSVGLLHTHTNTQHPLDYSVQEVNKHGVFIPTQHYCSCPLTYKLTMRPHKLAPHIYHVGVPLYMQCLHNDTVWNYERNKQLSLLASRYIGS